MTTVVGTLGAVLMLLAGRLAGAQCLPLTVLAREATEGRLTDAALPAHLPAGDWELHRTAPAPYWLYVAPAPDASEVPAGAETRVEVRHPNQQVQADVVLKTTYKDCFDQARAELRRLKLTGEAVTCLQCEATRYAGAGFVLTLYNQQALYSQGKTSHPLVLVLHPTAAPAPTLAGPQGK